MQRRTRTPRADWAKIVGEQGLLYHSPRGNRYWDESVYYEFSLAEIAAIEKATGELYDMYLAAAEHVIQRDRFRELAIPEKAIPYIKRAWEEEPPSIYGRFDLAFDGSGPPKLLEFNADTPTALLEAAVIQWSWMEECFPKLDQFNSIHEKLIEKWKDIKPALADDVLYFCHMDDSEDWMTVSYLRDTAAQAGINTCGLLVDEIGWNPSDKSLRDLEERQIKSMFKLYPWEWLLEEIPPGGDGFFHEVQWIEPIWRMLWSNKGMLAILWELYPDSPYLLESRFDLPPFWTSYVKKPFLSREGANVEIITPDSDTRCEGPYDGGPCVYQAIAPIPSFSDRFPVLGSWYITDQGAAGMGIRESDSMITDNFSRFVPHVILD